MPLDTVEPIILTITTEDKNSHAIAPYRRIYSYITLAYQHAIPAGTCPEPVFPYIQYLLSL